MRPAARSEKGRMMRCTFLSFSVMVNAILNVTNSLRVPTKRTRSASTGSDRQPLATITADAVPLNGLNVKAAPTPTLPTSKSASRNKRAGGGSRKMQQVQEFTLDGEEGQPPRVYYI